MIKEHVNGFENVGATLNQFKNFQRDIKCFIHEKDGQLFIDRFKSMAENRSDFFFDYDVDSDGSLRRAIWADGLARRNYEVFGDALSFDPTYSTNKYSMVFTPFTGVDNHKRTITFCGALIANEDFESFNWVFDKFLNAMGGKEPEYIITDQDPAIIKSVGHIFKRSRHRFCMWHIMNKVPVKFGGSSSDLKEFVRKLNDITWDVEIGAVDFDCRWMEIMNEHDVGKGDWFEECFSIRKQWVMAHCRDLRMGSLMRTTQRSESSNSFFKKFEHKSGTLVEFWLRFERTSDMRCNCTLFERKGIPCRHIIWLCTCHGIDEIPSSLLARRWMKEQVCDIGESVQELESISSKNLDGRQIETTKLWAEIHETVTLVQRGDLTNVIELCENLKKFREDHKSCNEKVTKEQEFESLLGCKVISEISIMPPKKSKNKGSGKRMLSSKNVVVAVASKPKRLCKNCKQLAHHDKRNCPFPFVED
ncbi:hypothetical protein RND81_06G235400 [Saponaria officinalis]|uniref:SWIM-type domain-containing protein n=1 Tax=Saponaria officinalis TaxID=3572 RepID=A0AAW1KD95_SAPOF